MKAMRTIGALAGLALLCSAAGDGARLVYEVAPEHAEATVAVLRARLGKSVEVNAAGEGRIHVELDDRVDGESLRPFLETPGELELLLEARASDWGDADAKAATRAFVAWMEANPRALPSAYSPPLPEEGGPPDEIVFALTRDEEAPLAQRAVALVRAALPAWRFTNEAVASVRASVDDLGYDALAFELEESRVKDMGDFTKAHLKRQLAVVVDGEVLTLATIEEQLLGSFLLGGGRRPFGEQELGRILLALRSGPLPAPLRFVEERRSR